MRRINKVWAVLWLALSMPLMTWTQTVRLVNGTAVPGDVTGVTDEGIQIKTQTGVRTLTWDSLAPSTRFRYQLRFRANYDAVLRGTPRARWTNAPDPAMERELSAMLASRSAPAEEAARTAPTTAVAPASQLIFEDIKYAEVPPLNAGNFPNASFRDLENAAFVGFQYGAGAKDVLYMAFDSTRPKDFSDVLYVYSPGATEFSGTVRIKGFKKGSGIDERMTYRKLSVQTLFGKTQALFEFEPETKGPSVERLMLTINVNLIRDRTKSRFLLFREVADLQHGEGRIALHGVLDMPNLWISCRAAGGNAEANVALFMGNMVFVPRDGMDTRATVTVSDDTGQTVYRDSPKMDLFPPPANGISVPLRRLMPGKTYKVVASMDLGPFLGAVEASDTLVMPAP